MKKLVILFLVTIYTILSEARPSASFEVSISGKGDKPLVLIPGYACSAEVWKETIEKYDDQYKCYALTMAGFAGTPPQDQPDLNAWAEDIAQFLKEENLTNVTLIGHSIGGLMSMLIAAKHPERVEKLIIVDALPCLAALYNPSFQPQEKLNCAPHIQQFTSLGSDQFYKIQLANMNMIMKDTVHLHKVVTWSVISDRATLGSIYCQFLNIDLRQAIDNIKCPALVLLEAPFVEMKPAIEEQYANLRSALIRYAPTGLHFIMYDAPKWYLEQLDAFLTD